MNLLKKITNKFKVDALIVDSARGNLNLVEDYIRTGVNINGVDPKGNSALMFAASYGHYKIVELLLKNGANPNQRNITEGFSAIFDAIKNTHIDVVKILIENGASLTITDNQGNTPLLGSIYNNRSDEVTVTLIEANSDVNYKNKIDGFYPIIAATILGNYKICQKLIEYGAKKDVADINGITPYIYAVNLNNVNLIKLLSE